MLTVDFINVGYGDSILIREQSEGQTLFTMLIDCGDLSVGKAEEPSKRIKAADFLKKEGVAKLDVLVITHLHLDHVGGLLDLLGEIQTDELWTNYLPQRQHWGSVIESRDGDSPGADCLLTSLNLYLKALSWLEEKGTKTKWCKKSNEVISLGHALQAELFIDEDLLEAQEEIWQRALSGTVSSDELNQLDLFINNTSLRMRLHYAGKTIELPGDIYALRWQQHPVLPCNILKLPHHGHKDSLTKNLAQMLAPDYTVISVSNSRKDCPSQDVIALAQEYSHQVLFTDAVLLQGQIPEYHESVRFCIDEEGGMKRSADSSTSVRR